MRAIGTRRRRGLNRDGSEAEILARVTPGCVRDADKTDRSAFTEIEAQFCKLKTQIQQEIYSGVATKRFHAKRGIGNQPLRQRLGWLLGQLV